MRQVVQSVILVSLLILSPLVFAQELPPPKGRVNDFANLISATEEQEIESVIATVENATPAQIAVVTVNSYSPYGSIEQFGVALAQEWGVGASEDDSGIVLILSISERETRIEVGYGLEGAIPDGVAGGILRTYMNPEFGQGNYGAGMLNGVAAVAELIAAEYDVELATPAPIASTAPAQENGGIDASRLLYFLFILLFFGGRWFLWPLLFAGRRRGIFGGGFGTGGGSRGGFGGGGFSGGSGGGFGGGGFGGGGASGSF